MIVSLYLIHLAPIKTCGWTTLQMAQLGVQIAIHLSDRHKGVFYKRQTEGLQVITSIQLFSYWIRMHSVLLCEQLEPIGYSESLFKSQPEDC